MNLDLSGDNLITASGRLRNPVSPGGAFEPIPEHEEVVDEPTPQVPDDKLAPRFSIRIISDTPIKNENQMTDESPRMGGLTTQQSYTFLSSRTESVTNTGRIGSFSGKDVGTPGADDANEESVREVYILLEEPMEALRGYEHAGLHPILIIKTFDFYRGYSGVWKVKKVSRSCRKLTCTGQIRGLDVNSYEFCSATLDDDKPQIHFMKRVDTNAVKLKFQNGYVQLAPPLEFRFRSTVFSISDIDNVRQSIRADIFCEFRVKRISRIKNLKLMTALLAMYGVHEKVIKFANQTEVVDGTSEYWVDLSVDTNNDLYDYTIKKRLQGVFIDSMELQEFPFDREEINFRIAVSSPVEMVSLIPNEKYPGHFIASGFQLEDLFKSYTRVDLTPGVTDKFESSVELIYPMMTITVYMDRKPWYYVYNVVLPMMILTFLASVAFSGIKQTSRGDKLSIALTVLFTAVAYKFVVANSLPQISYLTELDRYVNMCFLFITILVTEIASFPSAVYYLRSVYAWLYRMQCTEDSLDEYKEYESFESGFAWFYVLSFLSINAYWAHSLFRRINNRPVLVDKNAVIQVEEVNAET